MSYELNFAHLLFCATLCFSVPHLSPRSCRFVLPFLSSTPIFGWSRRLHSKCAHTYCVFFKHLGICVNDGYDDIVQRASTYHHFPHHPPIIHIARGDFMYVLSRSSAHQYDNSLFVRILIVYLIIIILDVYCYCMKRAVGTSEKHLVRCYIFCFSTKPYFSHWVA